MQRFFVHLLFFCATLTQIRSLFVLIIIDNVDQRFQYITSTSDASLYAGYNIDVSDFRARMEIICDGFDKRPQSEDWISEIWIDKLNTEGVFVERLQAVYSCVDITQVFQPKHKLLPKVMRKLTNSFERHIPKRWAELEGFNKFNCSDIYGRPIPMPVGVHRCYVQHTRQYGTTTIVDADYGTDSKAKNHLFAMECEESISWKPFRSNNQTDLYLGDGECVIRMSLMEMSFFCCCYTDSSQCNIANVYNDGLTCPKSLQFKSMIDLDTKVETMLPNQMIMKASELAVTQNCYARVAFDKQDIDRDIDVKLIITNENDGICKDTFKTRTPIEPCKPYSRTCMMDVDSELVFCCHFIASEVVQKNEDTILTIHKEVYAFLNRQASVSLHRLSNCLHPWGFKKMTNDDGCVFFYDIEMETFVNIRRENIVLTEKQQKVLDKLIDTDVDPGKYSHAYFYGRYNTNYPGTFGCLEHREEWQKPNNTAFPLWYEFSFVVFKCVNGPGATSRCDDFRKSTYSVKSQVGHLMKPQYVCLDGKSTNRFKKENYKQAQSADGFCLEYVFVNDDDTSHSTALSRNEMLASNRIWLTKKDQENHDNIDFFCGITKDGKTRFCACPANGMYGCNTGEYVQTYNHIAKQEKFVEVSNYELEDGRDKRVCTLPRYGSAADKCLEIMEHGTDTPCFFLLYEKNTKADIACVREPNLTHRRRDQRMKYEQGWHDYQLCLTVKIPDNPGYKCVLKDNKFDNYHDPVTVCCCKSQKCGEAYEKLLKRAHWKETRNFVKK
uniref:Kringle domain-containing protein n=1 Tax=Panagrellus redivivus TaxID=6233 RepID=A0A7E4VGN7_PANRE